MGIDADRQSRFRKLGFPNHSREVRPHVTPGFRTPYVVAAARTPGGQGRPRGRACA